MRNIIKNITKRLLLVTRDILDIFILFQELSVLCYHSVGENSALETVSKEAFLQQISYLSREYNIISLDDIVDFIKEEKKIPKKSVAITFDDGYSDFIKNALPILKKYSAPATIFIIGESEKSRDTLRNNIPILNAEEINLLKRKGVSIQYHSKTHRLLDKISLIELENEVRRTGDYRYFAYPGGRHSANVAEAIKKAGYEAAFSISPGLINKEDNIFKVKRNVIVGTASFWQFRFLLSEANNWYLRLLKFLKK